MRTVVLQEGQCGIFGYGSLLLRSSMEATLGHAYEGSPIYCRVRGWRRVWNSIMPNQTFYWVHGKSKIIPDNIVYLNVEEKNACDVNGLLYAVTAFELEAFDAREWIYKRIDVTDSLVDVKVTGGRVYMYIGFEPYILSSPVSPAKAAIRKTYLAIIDAGLFTLGEEAKVQYEASTFSLPRELVIDDVRDDGGTASPFRRSGPC